ncbi:hypothetical protein MMC26_003339 [Xylographa opegraphella]|nr:hypothetical protein [Xylographa opegraphella]
MRPFPEHGGGEQPRKFETLPQEIRYEIYRYLLRTSYTLVDKPRRQRYEMHPAILRVNRAISTEAKLVMEENDFVVVRLDNNVGHVHPYLATWFKYVPRFERLPARARTQQALSVSILHAKECSVGITSILSDPEILEPLLQFLWRSRPTSPLIMRLHLGTKTSRRAMALLQPFLKMHNHRTISISGTVDEKHAQGIIDQIVASPAPGFVIGVMNDYTNQAEECYVQGFYRLADRKWKHIIKYCEYVLHNTGFGPTEWKTLEYEVQPTSFTVTKARLGIIKAYLRFGDYSAALAKCHHAFIGVLYIGDEHAGSWIFEIHEAVTSPLHRDYFEPAKEVYREALAEVFAIANAYGAMSSQTFEKYMTLLERNDGFGENSNVTPRMIGDVVQ